MAYEWLDFVRRVQAVARTGLNYTEGKYDRERYEELYELSLNLLETCSDTPATKAREFFGRDQDSYITPKVDIRAVVFQDGKILMVKEDQDGKWALPGGWADVNYSPKEVAVKEVWEEAGLIVEADRLLAVFDKQKHAHPPDPIHAYKFFVLCRFMGGEPSTGMETLAVGFFEPHALPELSEERNTAEQVAMMFAYLNDPAKPVWLD